MKKLDTFERSHLKRWLEKKLSYGANLESFVVLIEEWLQEQTETKEYWLNKGWPSVWEQFVKDNRLKVYTE